MDGKYTAVSLGDNSPGICVSSVLNGTIEYGLATSVYGSVEMAKLRRRRTITAKRIAAGRQNRYVVSSEIQNHSYLERRGVPENRWEITRGNVVDDVVIFRLKQNARNGARRPIIVNTIHGPLIIVQEFQIVPNPTQVRRRPNETTNPAELNI